jgi:zinc transport system substrate-binding protein
LKIENGMRAPVPLYLLLIIVLLFSSCGRQGTAVKDQENGIRVAVSILPQKYFVQRIAGDKAIVHVMVPPGHSPATYAPTPRQMRELSRAQIYFRIGHIPFESAWMSRIASANPRMEVVDTSSGIKLIDSSGHPKNDSSYAETEHEDFHEHRGIDPHTWLSPEAVKIQAKHMLVSLAAHDPANMEFYKANLKAFLADIDELHRETGNAFKDLSGTKFMVFHPAWGYFARDYGLVQLAVESGGKSPSPAALKRVIDRARKENIRVIFVQQQFDTHSAEAVAADINGSVIQLDPLAPDWLENMKKIARTLKESLK